IYNGLDAALFDASRVKEDCVLAVGRVWDNAKGIPLLLERRHGVPIWVVGPEQEPGSENHTIRETAGDVAFLGKQRPERLRSLYPRAGAYAATSIYEPFGLAPLEAAFSRCALTASDIASFDEVWGDAPVYFRSKDADDLARAIRVVTSDPVIRAQAAERAWN